MTFVCEPIRARWELEYEAEVVRQDEDIVRKRYLEFSFHGSSDPRMQDVHVYAEIVYDVSPVARGECESCGEKVVLRSWWNRLERCGHRIEIGRRELHLINCLTLAEGVATGLIGTVMACKVAMQIFMRLFVDSPGRYRRWLDEFAPGAFRYFGTCRVKQGERKLDKRLKCHIQLDPSHTRTACGRPLSRVSRYTTRPAVRQDDGTRRDPEDYRMWHLGITDPGYCSLCLRAVGEQPPEI